MSEMKAAFKGLDECKVELKRIAREGDVATSAAVKASASVVSRAIKSRMRGKPRWNHRGASTRTGPEVNVSGPAHNAHGGGPGKFTGTLASGVRTGRKPRKLADGYSGAVIMGSKDTKIRNLYKGRTEQKFPFWAPGVAASEARVGAAWEKAWDKVLGNR
jgi:hypothetical protein